MGERATMKWSGCVRTGSYQLCRPAPSFLGRARLDARNASRKRHRGAVPLRDLYLRFSQRSLAEESLAIYQKSLTAAGFGKITTEIVEGANFYYAEDYHQQYLGKNPGGYCGLGGLPVPFVEELTQSAK